MNRRLIMHYRGVCKNIDTGQRKIIPEIKPMVEPPPDLQTIQKTEMENKNLLPDFFNHCVTQNFPLLFTAEDFKKGLENKTGDFFRNIDEIDENEKKIQIIIKIRKHVLQ